MSTTRKLFSLLVAIALTLGVAPISAFAVEGAELAPGEISAAESGASLAVSTSVYVVDQSGDYVETDSIESALSAAGADPLEGPNGLAVGSSDGLSVQASDGFVIVLDPGHGGSDGGATGIGFMEKDVNLKIAQYCKEKLEQTPGVTVYMTRTSDVYVSLNDRIEFAVDHGADLVVSIHNNSNGGQASGSEVIVPREGTWYYETAYLTGQELGKAILKNLNALGLGTHAGVYSRDNTVEAEYPDGTLADYYALINGPRWNGILGIIVEHAFVNNASDAAFLSKEENLKKLGEADAEAIIGYYDSSEAIDRLYWSIYDYDYYTTKYPAVKDKYGTSLLRVFGHFKSVGMGDGLRGNILFDVEYYKSKYPDLQGVFGDDLPLYYQHFMEYGMSEARESSADFNPKYYKANYADLRAAFKSDWEQYYKHYLEYGVKEGRVANELIEGAVLDDDEPISMYRLYNPYSGEHFYTASGSERASVVAAGWTDEGVGWVAPSASTTPVYRLYNSYAGDHHYTMDADERAALVEEGWTDEGVGWYSDDAKNVPLYRQYNPNQFSCNHNYTTNKAENDSLIAKGWIAEGIAWYGVDAGSAVEDDPDDEEEADEDEAIMGTSETSVEQMVRRFTAIGKPYPSSVYTQYGAATIDDFCQILLEEANDEGVRAEVVFAQAMHETGWLQFGNDVSAEQCNFAGIGATGGVPGNSFNDNGADSVRIGLRAQVQHLKAYASTEALNHDVVDPRFSLVTRGCATTVQALSGKWATGSTYGDALCEQIQRLLAA